VAPSITFGRNFDKKHSDMNFFDLNFIAFEAFNYKMSWLELAAVMAGLSAVWLSAKEHILTWPIGLVNVVLSSLIFFKIGLYADFFLQFYFFATGLLGWWLWAKRNRNTSDKLMKISYLSRRQQILMTVSIIGSSLVFGYFVNLFPKWYPSVFPTETAFPYADSLVMMMSIFGNYLLALKKIESWILWVLVDMLAPILYYQKGILLISLEYVIFLGLASFALYNWLKLYHGAKV
jgi:nicotinamide mononucleotide transporter